MSEPRWLRLDEVLVTHERQLGKLAALPAFVKKARRNPLWTGRGTSGPVARRIVWCLPRPMRSALPESPFVDGNKRVAFLSMTVFLRLNDRRFAPPQSEATAAIIGLAAGEIAEESLARWIRDNLAGPPPPEGHFGAQPLRRWIADAC